MSSVTNANVNAKRKLGDLELFCSSNSNTEAVRKVMNNPAILAVGIFPFLGAGRHAFLARVSKSFLVGYVTSVNEIMEDLPLVDNNTIRGDADEDDENVDDDDDDNEDNGENSRAKSNHTFYSVAFSSLSCAEFWEADTAGTQQPPRNDVRVSLHCQSGCTFCPKVGSSTGVSVGGPQM